MGAKTWMLVYSNGEASDNLKNGASLGRQATFTLLSKLYPDDNLEPVDDGDLSFTNPPDDISYAEGIFWISVGRLC